MLSYWELELDCKWTGEHGEASARHKKKHPLNITLIFILNFGRSFAKVTSKSNAEVAHFIPTGVTFAIHRRNTSVRRL